MNKQLTFLLSLTFLFLFSGSVYGQEEVNKNAKRLKNTNSCVKCTLVEANLTKANLTDATLSRATLTKATLSGANLYGANLSGAKMENIKNLDKAIKCKTIMPWGEENSGC